MQKKLYLKSFSFSPNIKVMRTFYENTGSTNIGKESTPKMSNNPRDSLWHLLFFFFNDLEGSLPRCLHNLWSKSRASFPHLEQELQPNSSYRISRREMLVQGEEEGRAPRASVGWVVGWWEAGCPHGVSPEDIALFGRSILRMLCPIACWYNTWWPPNPLDVVSPGELLVYWSAGLL